MTKAEGEMKEAAGNTNELERRVTTPLPSKTGRKQKAKQKNNQSFRDINEDDDGYHPYCDGPERKPVYEEDPWR